MRFLMITMLILFSSAGFVQSKDIRPRRVLKMINGSAVLSNHFTGFALYDLKKRKMVAGYNADKYFTPASNTKLFTFYGGLKLLKDSIAGIQYVEKGDSLIFWGTGDPTFLNAGYKQQLVLDRLRSSNRRVFWAYGVYPDPFYGTGWTYDDYNEYYQPEMSELPIHGNVIVFSSNGNQMVTYPEFNRNSPFQLNTVSKAPARFRISRDIQTNEFSQPPGAVPANFNQTVPFKWDRSVASSLLKFNIPNFSGTVALARPAEFNTIRSLPSDTLYKNMLLPSDNFIAEQILLNIAAEKGLEMKTPVVIDHIITNYLNDLPDKPVWVDGSGLSRQNLFTPRSIVKLCEKIYDEVADEKRLFGLLPAGGKTGTLKNLYRSEEPFVFAKTGSLSNNHNQSGYVVTKSGKRLIYSFMNNNFVRPGAEVRAEMERIITLIHEKY